ncbi:DUF4398 domain-containing protein [Candidatus Poribacteria bacterium]
MPTLIHRYDIWAGPRPAHIITQYLVLLVVFCLSCSALFSVVGCSAGQPIDVLFAAASSQLADAQKAGAEQFAESELKEGVSLLAEAELAIENKDKGARVIINKALAQARLAEALARQSKAENETAQLEAELEKASTEADQAHQERQAAESKLTHMMSE